MRIGRTRSRARIGAFTGALLADLVASVAAHAQSAPPINDWAAFRTALAAC